MPNTKTIYFKIPFTGYVQGQIEVPADATENEIYEIVAQNEDVGDYVQFNRKSPFHGEMNFHEKITRGNSFEGLQNEFEYEEEDFCNDF